MTPKGKRGWGNSVVIGTVTNNNDPDKLGRVRVKYPALGDDTEGWWARVAAPNAGSARGLLMMPQVGDEVVIGVRARRRPQAVRARLALERHGASRATTSRSSTARSRSSRTRRSQIHAKDVITIKTDKDFTLETQGRSSRSRRATCR